MLLEHGDRLIPPRHDRGANSTTSAPLSLPTAGPLLGAGLLWTWQLWGFHDLPPVLFLVPALQLLPLLQSPHTERMRRLLPLLALMTVTVSLVFWTDNTGRMCGIGVAMAALLWAPQAQSRYELVSVATIGCVVLAVVLTAQGAPAPIVLSTGAIALLGAVLDTDRHQIHMLTQQLDDTRLRLEMALAQGQAGVFEVDLQTGTALYSPRFREVLGYDGFSAFPPLPTRIDSDELVWPDDTRLLRSALVAVRRTAGVLDEELRMVSASGHPIWVHVRGTARMDADGEVHRLVGSILDVSARRSADELADSFLRAASLRIRAPLTSIRGVHRMLGNGAFGPVSPLAQRMVAIADRNSARLEDLVEHLIALRRVRRGRLTLDATPTSLQVLVDEAAAEARALYGSDLAIDVVHDASETLIDADRARLRAALTSLIGVGFDHASGSAVVTVHTALNRNTAHITMLRQGNPTDRALHDEIVQLFNAAAIPGGTGLDTANIEVARAVIDAMDGHLNATSTDDGGLRIGVTLANASKSRAKAYSGLGGQAS